MTLHDNPVRNVSLLDHIRVYDGALSSADCRALIARFESSPDQENCSQDGSYRFVQIDITEKWPDANRALIPVFLSHFNKYQLALNTHFWPPKFAFEHLRIKRYLPNGRDEFPLHVDVMCQEASRRFMTAILYLNSVDGGETVFPNLGISVAPQPGTLLAFPPLWPFPHAGLPPRSGPKYILHTYMCYPS